MPPFRTEDAATARIPANRLRYLDAGELGQVQEQIIRALRGGTAAVYEY